MLNRTLPPQHTTIYQIDFPKVVSSKLNNKINLHSLDLGTQPIIKLEIIFPRGGSFYEQKTAVSFLALKMLREGTQSYKSGELSNKLAQLGAFFDISPSFDVPSISLYCLSKHLSQLLPVVREIVTVPTFPSTELKRMCDIEVQQLQMQNEKTNIVASKKFRQLTFGDKHPYGKVFTKEDLQAVSPSDLKQFHQSNLTEFEILVSGQLNEGILNIISSSFDKVDPGSASNNINNKIALELNQKKEKFRENRDSSLQSSIRIGKRLINKTSPEYISLLILNQILGGYFGSRLMKNIREDKGFTYGISSSIAALKHDAYLVISTDVKKEFVEATISEINKELSLLCSNEISNVELNAVKNHMLGHFQSQLNSPFSLVEKFKEIHIHGLDYSYYDQYLSTLESITAEEIVSLAKKFLQPTSMHQVIIG